MKVIDYFNSHEEFKLEKSNELKGLLQTSPLLTDKELEKYYGGDYISHENKKNTLFEKIYSIIQKYNLQNKLEILKKNSDHLGSVLDFGCGKGDFVHYLSQKGITAYGYEPGQQAQENFLKQNKRNQLIHHWDDLKKYDVITLFHVLEHIPNFIEVFQNLKNSLKPGGLIILALPNYKSFDAQFYNAHWGAYDVPRHQWHFSQESIVELSHRFGMNLVNKYPMIFDAVYVSLISEKYRKSGLLGQLRGLLVGVTSNVKAISTSEYSSIMYILKN